jgi:hypothetical protein
MTIVKTERFGKKVWASKVAEQGRKYGCLCIRTDPATGRKKMCRRLEGNIATEEELRLAFGKEKAEKYLKDLALEVFRDMVDNGVSFEQYADNFVCPVALVNYINCLVSNAAFAVSRCPGYLPPDAEKE